MFRNVIVLFKFKNNIKFQIVFKNVCTKILNKEDVKSFETIPRPFQFPILGNWHLYKLGIFNAEKYHEVLYTLYKRYGPIVYEKIGLEKAIIHVFDPEDVETVYRNEDKIPDIFPLSSVTKRFRKERGVSPGLGNSNGEEWYKLVNCVRQLMSKNSSIHQFLYDTEVITNDLIIVIRKKYNDNNVINLRNLLGRWSLEVGGKIIFGKRLAFLCGNNEKLGNKIIEANQTAFQLSTHLRFSLPFYNYIDTPKWKTFIKNENLIFSAIENYFDEAIRNIQLNTENKIENDQYRFLLTLLQKEELNREDVKIIATSLFIDRLSTTVPILINSLYALAKNPDVQEKAYREICEVSISKTNLNPKVLNELKYVKAVIKETFRMYPNGTEIARINKKPLILSNYQIPPKSHLSLNLLVHFKDEKYFLEPNKFKPERWLRGNEDSRIHPFLLSPFGFGARTCTGYLKFIKGKKFAEQDLSISLFNILKNFKLVYATSAPPINFLFHTLIFPGNNLPIKFIPR